MKKSELKELINECIIEENSLPERDAKAARFLRDSLTGLNNAAQASNKNTIDGKEIRKLYTMAKKLYDRMK